MLALRLSEGLIFENFENRFGHSLPESIIKRVRELQKHGLINVDDKSIALTVKGFLVSNSVISSLI